MGVCLCGDCFACELALALRHTSKDRRGGPQLPPPEKLPRLIAYSAALAKRVGLPDDEVLELIANGRTEAEVLALEQRRPPPPRTILLPPTRIMVSVPAIVRGTKQDMADIDNASRGSDPIAEAEAFLKQRDKVRAKLEAELTVTTARADRIKAMMLDVSGSGGVTIVSPAKEAKVLVVGRMMNVNGDDPIPFASPADLDAKLRKAGFKSQLSGAMVGSNGHANGKAKPGLAKRAAPQPKAPKRTKKPRKIERSGDSTPTVVKAALSGQEGGMSIDDLFGAVSKHRTVERRSLIACLSRMAARSEIRANRTGDVTRYFPIQ